MTDDFETDPKKVKNVWEQNKAMGTNGSVSIGKNGSVSIKIKMSWSEWFDLWFKSVTALIVVYFVLSIILGIPFMMLMAVLSDVGSF